MSRIESISLRLKQTGVYARSIVTELLSRTGVPSDVREFYNQAHGDMTWLIERNAKLDEALEAIAKGNYEYQRTPEEALKAIRAVASLALEA